MFGFLNENMKDKFNMSLIGNIQSAECGKFMDKHLEGALDKLDKGLKDLETKYPGIQRANLSYGLRGTRYYIEFPITGRNIDAFSILTKT